MNREIENQQYQKKAPWRLETNNSNTPISDNNNKETMKALLVSLEPFIKPNKGNVDKLSEETRNCLKVGVFILEGKRNTS